MKKVSFSVFRARWLVIVAVIVIMGIMTGCSNFQSTDVASGGTGDIGNFTTVTSGLVRDTSQASDTDVASVVQGNTIFAVKTLSKDPLDSNSFFSPYSITMAFALLAPGTAGTTLSGIEEALSFPLPQSRFNPALNRLETILAGNATGTLLPSGVASPKFSAANAVWAQKGFSILSPYLDTLALNYGAGVYTVDFAQALESSRQTINNWAAQSTNNKILDLIPTGGITSATRLVLTNAVWFKSGWSTPFLQSATTDRTFDNRDTSPSTIPFMAKKFTVPYVQTSDFQAVDIPYVGNALSLLVIMPKPGTIDAFIASLTPATLTHITTNLTTTYVDLALPKFNVTQKSNLNVLLKSLGMSDAFDPATADLSGIDGTRNLSVGNVFHQAVIGVDEQGTEAAAATAIEITTTAILNPSEALAVTIKNPFIFLIRDRTTGLILFMGKVVSL